MSAVVTSVLAKLQNRFPNQIGTNRQWSTSYVSSLILAAANAAEERIGMTWTSQVITLTNDTNDYALDSKFIEVVAVEFSLDGTTYQHALEACTFDDLDGITATWRDDTGERPYKYALFSTPGTQAVSVGEGHGCRIYLWRKMPVAGGAKVKVSGWGIDTAATNVPVDVQERVIMPYCMAVMRAEHDVREAALHYERFKEACDQIKGRFINAYIDQPIRPGVFR